MEWSCNLHSPVWLIQCGWQVVPAVGQEPTETGARDLVSFVSGLLYQLLGLPHSVVAGLQQTENDSCQFLKDLGWKTSRALLVPCSTGQWIVEIIFKERRYRFLLGWEYQRPGEGACSKTAAGRTPDSAPFCSSSCCLGGSGFTLSVVGISQTG